MPRCPEAVIDGPGVSGDAKLEEGAFVKIQGLKAAPQLNGTTGTCEQWDPDGGRWVVRLLSSGTEKRVRPENLVIIAGAAAKIRPGATVRLCGLQACPALNGAQGVCKDWIDGQSRWLVKLESGEEKRVRLENLEAADPGISVLGRDDAAASLRRSYVAMARSSRPADDCDDFVVADAGLVAGAVAGAKEPAADASGGTAQAAEAPDASGSASQWPTAGDAPRGTKTAKAAEAPDASGGAPQGTAAGDAPRGAKTAKAAEAPDASGGAPQSPTAGDAPRGAKTKKAQQRGGVKRFPRTEDGKRPKVFPLGEAVETWEQATEVKLKKVREECEASPDEVAEVADGLRCPKWLWEALYTHQQEGVRWLWSLYQTKQGGMLADDLGLGKTVQVVTFLASLHHSGHLRNAASPRGMLVVCPVTLMRQWEKELRVWYPRLEVRILHQLDSKDRKQLIASACSPQCVAITSYEILRTVDAEIVEVPWELVVLDEGQRIRNPHGLGTLAAKRFNTPHRIMLTGSPVHNNLQEMWSVMDFVRPGILGTLPVFLEEMARPIEAGSAAGASQARCATAYQMASALRELAKPAILRRTKSEIMDSIQLPKREEQVLLCHLTLDQYAAYLSFLQSQQAQLLRKGSREPGHLIHAINMCRRLCNHPDLLMGSDGNSESAAKIPDMWSCERSGKMKVLAEAMCQWKKEGHRVLVFVQTTQMLEVLEKWMGKQGYRHSRMDARTPINKRVQIVEEFNANTSLFVMLLTTRVGGVGLNIIGANRVVLFDPDWNPMTDIQARERACRIGQRREVAVFRLLLAGTLEEKIYKRQIAKQQLSQQVLTDAGARSQNFCKLRLADCFDLPPPPPGDHEEALVQLKEKYRSAFQTQAPMEEPEDFQQNSSDIVQAISDLGGDKVSTGKEASGVVAGSSALLQTLFDRQGIRASFNGDSVERLLVDRKSVREGASSLATKAVAALQRSAAGRADHGINEPTWTGKSGLAGAPPARGAGAPAARGVAERQGNAVAGSGTVGTSAAAGPNFGRTPAAAAGATSGRTLKRSRPPSADVMAGVERLAGKRPFPEAQRELAEAILGAFLDKDFAGPEHSLSTSQVLGNLGANVPADRRGVFKSLLQRVCLFEKGDGAQEQGRWYLRPEFWSPNERRVPAKAAKAAK